MNSSRACVCLCVSMYMPNNIIKVYKKIVFKNITNPKSGLVTGHMITRRQALAIFVNDTFPCKTLVSHIDSSLVMQQLRKS